MLDQRTQRNVNKLLAHPRFRAAYDFLLLRIEAGDAPEDLGQWWTDVQTREGHDPDGRPTRDQPRRRRRRRRRSSPAVNNPEFANGGATPR